ncbi:hypothetical protein JKG68_25270 [Microvirga aerilata]|uniref:Uncharacterized protein n=1 Tax=Microvirga aerilata TaxID=670292 RepID=A0A936ZM75_9HYPH|nr:hypothetical protein [Microvirga aerilata]MBL0407244.1 hypothetical protein [Microvirga aerilata]
MSTQYSLKEKSLSIAHAPPAPSAHAVTPLMERLQSCRNRYQLACAGYRSELNEIRDQAFQIGLQLRDNPEAWAWLIADPFWQGRRGHKPRPEHRADPFRWVLAYVFQAVDENDRKRVSKVAASLRVRDHAETVRHPFAANAACSREGYEPATSMETTRREDEHASLLGAKVLGRRASHPESAQRSAEPQPRTLLLELTAKQWDVLSTYRCGSTFLLVLHQGGSEDRVRFNVASAKLYRVTKPSPALRR